MTTERIEVAPALPTGARQNLWVSRGLLWPALLVAILLTQVPFLVTIYYSFQDWNLLSGADPKFAGFQNYVTVFANGTFMASLLATVIITALTVLGATALGLGFALLLERRFRGRALARTLMITPFLLMPAAAALIWKWAMLDASTGILNWFTGLFGIPPVAWSTDAPIAAVIIVLTWQYTPFFMLILLAGLQSQPHDVLEAASLDGAGRLKIFTLIRLPHLRQYLEIAVLLGSLQLTQAFDPIAILTRGSGGTKTLPYLLYERAFIGLDIGEAAAYGVITVLVTIVIAIMAIRLFVSSFKEGESHS